MNSGIEYAPGKYIVGKSPAMQRVFSRLSQYARSSAPVLITGDTGTGKELVARALHHHSGRKDRFVAVNCASVNESLFESEFFGHKQGAFTGAIRDRQGWFEQAAGGTLFLDEMGEMPLSQQAKLLRAIQERSVTPVGAPRPVPVSTRIVAATNVPVADAVQSGRFRTDLFDRLNVLPIHMPPLAERIGDFPLLVDHLVSLANAEEGTDVRIPRGETLYALEQAFGRGSIRVLKNTLRRIVIAKRQGRVSPDDLVSEGIVTQENVHPRVHAIVGPAKDAESLAVSVQFWAGTPFDEIMRGVGKTVLTESLRRHKGHAARAARELQMSKARWYRLRRSRVPRKTASPSS